MANLLFIHGFATDPLIWGLQIKEFSKKHRIYTDTSQINKLNQLIIVGWSMGGLQAFKLLREKKDKIKALVLVSAFPKFLKSEDYPYGLHPSHLKNLERKLRGDFEIGLRFFYSLLFNGKKVHPLIASLPTLQKEKIFSDLRRLEQEDEREFLSEIRIPTLIVQGEKDQIVLSETSDYLHEKIEKSERQIFPGVGHVPFLEVPDKFNASINDFIAKNEWA